MKINLSIIIPVYNAKKTLARSLESINNQIMTLKNLKVEIIIVVDDGKNYKNIIPTMKKNFFIKIVKTNGNKTGPGNARNYGIKEAKGEFIGYLDADDEWSENYLKNMYNIVKKFGLALSETRVYDGKKLLDKFKGNNKNYLSLKDIGENPCSFHPFVKKENQIKFENLSSQDVYNTAYLLNKKNKKLQITKDAYYKINLQTKSVTTEEGFSHKVILAYKKYQIKSLKLRNIKIARVFAVRRIINKKFVEWNKNNNKSFYKFLSWRNKNNEREKSMHF